MGGQSALFFFFPHQKGEKRKSKVSRAAWEQNFDLKFPLPLLSAGYDSSWHFLQDPWMKAVTFRGIKTDKPAKFSSFLSITSRCINLFPHHSPFSTAQEASSPSLNGRLLLPATSSVLWSRSGFRASIFWPSRFCFFCLLCTSIAFGKKQGTAAEAANISKFPRGPTAAAQKPIPSGWQGFCQ